VKLLRELHCFSSGQRRATSVPGYWDEWQGPCRKAISSHGWPAEEGSLFASRASAAAWATVDKWQLALTGWSEEATCLGQTAQEQSQQLQLTAEPTAAGTLQDGLLGETPAFCPSATTVLGRRARAALCKQDRSGIQAHEFERGQASILEDRIRKLKEGPLSSHGGGQGCPPRGRGSVAADGRGLGLGSQGLCMKESWFCATRMTQAAPAEAIESQR